MGTMGAIVMNAATIAIVAAIVMTTAIMIITAIETITIDRPETRRIGIF